MDNFKGFAIDKIEQSIKGIDNAMWHDKHDGLTLNPCETAYKRGYKAALVMLLQEFDKFPQSSEKERE